ncbi:unnamed protein product, partial [Discosporangium mesarthrocarpum]
MEVESTPQNDSKPQAYPEDSTVKVIVHGAGKHTTQKLFEKMLKSKKVLYRKAKKVPVISNATVIFDTAEMAKAGIEKIQEIPSREPPGTLTAEIASENKKRTAGSSTG